MKDFILDEEIKNVKSEKVKKYLKEVISSYYNNNYRSCIVILYSIVIFDFIEKLQTLSDVYEDSSATKFLVDFENKQQTNTKYSDLENLIIKEIKEKKILNAIELSQLEQLRNARNYCAHPVFKNDYELINPTKEQTLAHIRNMFESVFLKDAILNNKVFDDFLYKLVDFYQRNELDNLEKFLNGRYFSKMNNATKKYLFKKLWPYTFLIRDTDCEEYRRALFYALLYLIKTDTNYFIDYFKDNKEFFNSKILCEKIEIEFDETDFTFYDYPIFSLIYLLSEIPQLYKYINTDSKQEIEIVCRKNINILLISSFINTDIEKHVEEIKSKISGYSYCFRPGAFLKAYENSRYINLSPFKNLAIYYFHNNVYSKLFNPDYDYINWTYRDILSKILSDFNEFEVDELLKGMHKGYKSARCIVQLRDQLSNLIDGGLKISLDNYEIFK